MHSVALLRNAEQKGTIVSDWQDRMALSNPQWPLHRKKKKERLGQMQVVYIVVCDRLFRGYISWQTAEARGAHRLIQFTRTHTPWPPSSDTHRSAVDTHLWLTLSAAFAHIVVGYSHPRPQLRSVSRCNWCFFPHTKPLNLLSASTIQFVTKQQTTGLRWVRPEKIMSWYPRRPLCKVLSGIMCQRRTTWPFPNRVRGQSEHWTNITGAKMWLPAGCRGHPGLHSG